MPDTLTARSPLLTRPPTTVPMSFIGMTAGQQARCSMLSLPLMQMAAGAPELCNLAVRLESTVLTRILVVCQEANDADVLVARWQPGLRCDGNRSRGDCTRGRAAGGARRGGIAQSLRPRKHMHGGAHAAIKRRMQEAGSPRSDFSIFNTTVAASYVAAAPKTRPHVGRPGSTGNTTVCHAAQHLPRALQPCTRDASRCVVAHCTVHLCRAPLDKRTFPQTPAWIRSRSRRRRTRPARRLHRPACCACPTCRRKSRTPSSSSSRSRSWL